MTRSHEELSRLCVSRRGLLLGITGTLLSDVVTHYSLDASSRTYQSTQPDAKTLTSVAPGFAAANVRAQVAPLTPVFDRYGDTYMIEASGGVYDEAVLSERMADDTVALMKKNSYQRFIFAGVSMGGNVTASAAEMLAANNSFTEFSVEPHGVLLDTPSSDDALVLSPLQRAGEVLSYYPYGVIVNAASPKVSGMDMSLYGSQTRTITSQAAPLPDSLSFLSSLSYVESLQGGDVVDADISLREWRRTIADKRFRHVTVNMAHAALRENPIKSRNVLASIYQQIHSA